MYGSLWRFLLHFSICYSFQLRLTFLAGKQQSDNLHFRDMQLFLIPFKKAQFLRIVRGFWNAHPGRQIQGAKVRPRHTVRASSGPSGAEMTENVSTSLEH